MTRAFTSVGLWFVFAIVFFRQKKQKCDLSSLTNFHYIIAVITDMKDVIMAALVGVRHRILCQCLAGYLRFPREARTNNQIKQSGDSDTKRNLKSLCLCEKFQYMTVEKTVVKL